jgi:hypothetical protein
MANFFSAWCRKAIDSGIDRLVSVTQCLTDHAEGVVAYG